MPSGISITLMIGASTPRPVSAALSEAVDRIEVIHRDRDLSGFQIVFRVGREERADLQDDPILTNDLLKPFHRVMVTITLEAVSKVLIDGMITYLEFSPGSEPGESIYTITGEDVGIMMDLEEKSIEHPALNDKSIVTQILGQYAKYGLQPKLGTPTFSTAPTTQERTPVQLGTDLEYIQELADRHGFVFYITPGAVPGQNIAYWGAPERNATPQKPLTISMGSFTNVETINFQYNALSAKTVTGQVQDRRTNQIQDVSKLSSQRSQLSQEPALTTQLQTRRVKFRETAREQAQANAYAQAIVDRSIDSAITATGELNTLVYGGLLQRGGLIDVRGAGYTYDGRYYVKQVTHRIREGEYHQQFVLTREGLGTTISSVSV